MSAPQDTRRAMMVAAPTANGTFVGFVESWNVEEKKPWAAVLQVPVKTILDKKPIPRPLTKFAPEPKKALEFAIKAVKAVGAKDGFVIVLCVRRIDGGYAWRAGVIPSKVSEQKLLDYADRIHNAQTRAFSLRCARTQANQPRAIPPVILRKACQEVFPKQEMPIAEWLAYVSKECGEAFAKAQLKEWVDCGKYDLLSEFAGHHEDARLWTGRTSRKSIWWFLLTHWHQLDVPGMNATKAHTMAVKVMGANNAGTLARFQKLLTGNGVAFHPAHGTSEPRGTSRHDD